MDATEFIIELASLINRASWENRSNTPDFILAEYMYECLCSFEEASNAREKWYGKKLEITTGSQPAEKK